MSSRRRKARDQTYVLHSSVFGVRGVFFVAPVSVADLADQGDVLDMHLDAMLVYIFRYLGCQVMISPQFAQGVIALGNR